MSTDKAHAKPQQATKMGAGCTSAAKVRPGAGEQEITRPATSGVSLTLPLPPTINHAYGQRKGGGRFIKPAGIAFRQAVAEIVAEAGHKTLEGRVALFAAIYPATRARQDLDNRSKALQDALTHAGVFLDDEQIDDLRLVRREVVKGGMVKVVITEMSA